MAKEGNAQDFTELVHGGIKDSTVKYHEALSPEYVLVTLFQTNHYVTNYSHAVVKYHEACGCKVVQRVGGSDNNSLYLHYTKPLKSVDPTVWFTNVYKGGRFLDPVEIIITCIFVGIISLIVLGLICNAITYFITTH